MRAAEADGGHPTELAAIRLLLLTGLSPPPAGADPPGMKPQRHRRADERSVIRPGPPIWRNARCALFRPTSYLFLSRRLEALALRREWLNAEECSIGSLDTKSDAQPRVVVWQKLDVMV
jgi:hypothetical protein